MATYWAECLADTPTLLFKMDEASGNLVDSSGSGYSGVASGTGLTYRATGPDATGVPYGITMNGTGYFSVTDSGTGLDLGDGPFTIEFWMKRNDLTTTRYICGKADNSTAPGYGVEMRNGSFDTMRLVQGAGSTNINSTSATDYWSTTNWYHVALTRGASASGTVYIDGSAATTSTSAVTFSDNNLALLIGRFTASVGAFDGSIAGFALYKSSLSGARIAAHYAARSNGSGSSRDPLGMLGLFGV